MFKQQTRKNPELKIERSHFVLVGVLLAAVAVSGCGSVIPDGRVGVSGSFKVNNTKYINNDLGSYYKSKGPSYKDRIPITKSEYNNAVKNHDEELKSKYRKPKSKVIVNEPPFVSDGGGSSGSSGSF
jgi:hypothetical protein